VNRGNDFRAAVYFSLRGLSGKSSRSLAAFSTPVFPSNHTEVMDRFYQEGQSASVSVQHWKWVSQAKIPGNIAKPA